MMLIAMIFGMWIGIVGTTVAFDCLRDWWIHREKKSGKKSAAFYHISSAAVWVVARMSNRTNRKPKRIGSHRRVHSA